MAGKCVSYENVLSAMRDLAHSPQAKAAYIPHSPIGAPSAPSIGQGAEMALQTLETHPELAKLAKEMIDNASCSDISQMLQGVVAANRDMNLTFAADTAGHLIENFTDYVPFLSRRPSTTETTGMPPQYHKPGIIERGADAAPYLAVALATALAMHYGKKTYQRGREFVVRRFKR